MLDSRALTKLQSMILIAIIVFAGVGGGAAYVLLSGEDQAGETIKIGVLADLDGYNKNYWQEMVLAGEQINAEGGILGKQVEVIGEDCVTTSEGYDSSEVSAALTRLLTVHEVDFVIGAIDGEALFASQDIMAQHEKIYIALTGTFDELTQRVIDDYDKYKYYFSCVWNATSVYQGMTDGLLHFRELTGFKKVGYLAEDIGIFQDAVDGLDHFLPENGFELVYKGVCPPSVVDFSSYFAAAESAGVEVLVPLIAVQGVPFVKEYYDRQSPMTVYGGLVIGAATPNSWELLEGKCNCVTIGVLPAVAGYPLTSKTLPFRDAYVNRWNEISEGGGLAYDVLRYILTDAIERAGTTETDAVIEALEKTSVETATAKNWIFTHSHALMMGKNPNDPNADYAMVLYFQWQDGELVPVYPKKIMDEAGATYMFPNWAGPWE
ncbi:MAG: ABC transporter substrate-binding protein [Candidatus Bathyarchaeota archaeon]